MIKRLLDFRGKRPQGKYCPCLQKSAIMIEATPDIPSLDEVPLKSSRHLILDGCVLLKD